MTAGGRLQVIPHQPLQRIQLRKERAYDLLILRVFEGHIIVGKHVARCPKLVIDRHGGLVDVVRRRNGQLSENGLGVRVLGIAEKRVVDGLRAGGPALHGAEHCPAPGPGSGAVSETRTETESTRAALARRRRKIR